MAGSSVKDKSQYKGSAPGRCEQGEGRTHFQFLGLRAWPRTPHCADVNG